MTLRLANLFESHIKPIIYNWKSARRRNNKKSTTSTTLTDPNQPGTSKMATRATTSNGAGTSRPNFSSDSDDDTNHHLPHGSQDSNNKRTRVGRPPKRVHQTGSNSSNAVSSSVNNPEPGPSRGRKPFSRPNSQDSSSSSSASSSSSSDNENDSDESSIPLAALNDARKRVDRKHTGYSSEESYKPNKQNRPGTGTGSMKRRGRPPGSKKKKKKSKEMHTPKKRTRVVVGSSDEQKSESDYQERPQKRQKVTTNLNSPGVSTWHNTRSNRRVHSPSEHSSDNDDNDKKTILPRSTSKRNKRYESDQSYHADRPNNGRPVIESETDHDSPRPTRGSVRRAKLAWGRSEDDEEPDEPENQPSSSRGRPRIQSELIFLYLI